MRAFSSSRASRRHLGINPILKPHLMSRSATFASIQKELLARPPNFYQEGIRLQALRQLHASLPPLKISQADIGDHCKHYFQGSTEGCQLPQGHHIAFLNSTHPVDLLLPDGTDPDHSPGPPFTRRLWAGGSVAFSRARQPILRSKLVCRESIIDVNLKGLPPGDETSFETALGPEVKILVDVERRYGLNYDGESREICSPIIIERRTLCFMTPRTPQDITNRPGDQPVTKTIKALKIPLQDCATSYSQSFAFTPAMLARFSAVTFNAHKIHFDPQHCREVEGYRDLLVHGPLLLILMFSLFNSRGHIVANLDYQNLAPVYVDEEITVCVQQRKDNWRVWIAGPQGDLRVKGTAVLLRATENGH